MSFILPDMSSRIGLSHSIGIKSIMSVSYVNITFVDCLIIFQLNQPISCIKLHISCTFRNRCPTIDILVASLYNFNTVPTLTNFTNCRFLVCVVALRNQTISRWQLHISRTYLDRCAPHSSGNNRSSRRTGSHKSPVFTTAGVSARQRR